MHVPRLNRSRRETLLRASPPGAFKEPFTYYVITEGEGGLQMITLHVIESNTTTVKVITEGVGG